MLKTWFFQYSGNLHMDSKKKPEIISFIIRGEQFTSILEFGFFLRRALILHRVPIVTHEHELQRGPYVKSVISSEFTRTSKLKWIDLRE